LRILTVLLFVACVGQVIQTRKLKARVEAMASLLYEQSSPRTPQPGDYVMEIEVRTLGGAVTRFSFLPVEDEPRTKGLTIAVLKPMCDVCELELPVWNHLAKETRGSTEFIGVSLGDSESTAAFIKNELVNFPIYLGVSSTLRQLRLPGAPSLIRFSPRG